MKRVWIAVAAFVAVFSAAALWRWHVWSYGTDTGLFAQAIGDAFGGFRDGPEQGSHFRFHWAPWMALLWPLVAVTRLPLVLQLAQALLIGLSAVPLYALARKYTDERIAGSLAILALVYPPLCAVAFTEFHEIAIYPLIVLGLFWAADRGRWSIFALCACVSALIREEACLVFAIAGVTFAAAGTLRARGTALPAADDRQRGLLAGTPNAPRSLAAAGLGLAAINLGAFAFYYLAVTPGLGGWEPAPFYSYPFAIGPGATLSAMLSHPQYIGYVLTFGRLTYLIEAFAPLAFLPLFSRWSLLALPGFAVVLLSSNGIVWRMGSHYAMIWIPWLLIGVAATFARWYREGKLRRIRLWTRASIALCILVLVAFNPLHPAHYARPPYPVSADVERALASIPADAKVAVHDEWFTRIAYDHPYATVFLCPYVDYAVYADDFPNGYYQDQIVPEVRAEVARGQMREVARYGKVAVYSRTPDAGAKYGRCITFRPEGYATLRDFMNADLKAERAAPASR